MKSRAFVPLVALALCACAGGSETGNPVAQTSIRLGLHTSRPELVAVSSGAQGTVIEHAWMAFGAFAFMPGAQCAALDQFEHTGGTWLATDLAAPGAHVDVELESGAYCGLVVPLEASSAELPDAAPTALRDHSIVVEGRRADGVPFIITHPEQDELELGAIAGTFTIDLDGPGLLLSFDVAKWMDGIDLDRAEVSADQVIHIDQNTNRALLDQFELQVECALALYRDDNGSGALESSDALLARCIAN